MSNHAVTTKFEATFPTIEDVVIEVGERWIGQTDSPNITYGKADFPRCISCSCQSDMHDGLAIDTLLRQMVPAKQRELTVQRLCQTARHTPKGHLPCGHWFHCHIHVTYKD